MIPARACTPPPQRPPIAMDPPSTPGPGCERSVVGSEHAVMPPSPGPDAEEPTTDTFPPAPALQAAPKPKASQQTVATGSGIVQLPSTKKTTAIRTVNNDQCKRALDQSFRFLDLPPEIRNMIYRYTYDKPCQTLLVHRPRLATLRSRTRTDRTRSLASELTGIAHDEALTVEHSRSRSRKVRSNIVLRSTNRPFFGLTQVCRLIRQEYRPIYMLKQEVGMDLTNVVAYLETYYSGASDLLSKLAIPGEREADLPFSGNITIAVGDRVQNAEKKVDGVDVMPVLDVWANSYKIEAGFGRYVKELYIPMRDGEAKDLYRLFGRRVRRDRSCAPMNQFWRTILRTRSLAAVRIHRAPPNKLVGGRYIPQRPYIHFLFRKEWAEPWMVDFDSPIPNDWLEVHGFAGMEHYDVKIGVPPSANTEASFQLLRH